MIFYSKLRYNHGFHTDSLTGALWREGLYTLIIVITEKEIKNENENEVGARGMRTDVT